MNGKKVLLCSAVALLCLILCCCATPWGRAAINEWRYHIQKADDATAYQTRKEIEDTCRAMLASYTSDKMVYEQYRDSENEEQRSWSEQARMRANRTAASYNEYVLKNSFIWEDNIPDDIKTELPYL